MKFNIFKYVGIFFLSILIIAKFNIDLTNFEYVVIVLCIFLMSFERYQVTNND